MGLKEFQRSLKERKDKESTTKNKERKIKIKEKI